jgi:hypothetical protein
LNKEEEMKLATSTILAATLLAGSIFAGAQNQPTNNYNDQAGPHSMSSQAMPGGGVSEFHPMVAAQAAVDSTVRHEDRAQQQDRKQQKTDYNKNPYWEPKDWNYIVSESAGH